MNNHNGVPSPFVMKARMNAIITPTQETFQPFTAFGKNQMIKIITTIIIRNPKSSIFKYYITPEPISLKSVSSF
jgi:hypothetical protein